MSVSSVARAFGKEHQGSFDPREVEDFFDQQLTVNVSTEAANMIFVGNQMVSRSGVFVQLESKEPDISKRNVYKVCVSEFSQQVNFSETPGDSSFDGPVDEMGKKVMDYFFSKIKNDAIVYINYEKKTLVKNENGSISLI